MGLFNNNLHLLQENKSESSEKAYDFLIIGGCIMGLNLARALISKYPDTRFAIIEKEETIGIVQVDEIVDPSCKFYYTAESLKAKFTHEGNRAMKEYWPSHNLPINNC